MADHCRPVGFFDSGVGGVSVLKAAQEMMPGENYIYFGDSANAPYGEKDEHTIQALSMEAGRFLYGQGAKVIVVACNTATSAAVKMLRSELSIPVISIEPAVKPALESLRDGKVMVLATPATIAQERYLALIARLGGEQRVINVGCAGLAELIESGCASETSIREYLDGKIAQHKDEDVRAVVIGCTHYSLVSAYIRVYLSEFYQQEIRVFDGRYGTARQLKRVLGERQMACSNERGGSIRFFTSGDKEHIRFYQQFFDHFDQQM